MAASFNLRKYAAGKPCQIRIPGVCNGDPNTTVLCHLRLAGITGTAQKSPDLLGAWGCSACHAETEGNADPAVRLDFYEGIFRTQYQLIKAGIIRWDGIPQDTPF